MKITYVSFGKHVRSHEFLRIGERYVGFGTIVDMDYDKGLLTLSVRKDGETKVKKIGVPQANIASFDIEDKE
jgi:hypothetical protein